MATNSTYIYPVKPLKITQVFGANPEYYKQYGQKGHNGLDLAANLNAPVRAARDGVVKFSGKGSSLPYVGSIAGNYVLIDHGDMWTGYAHNNSNKVKAGQKVKQGDIIALAGRTGDASGVHVHFEFIAPANPVTNVNGYWGRLNLSKFVIKEQDMVTRDVMAVITRAFNGRALVAADLRQEGNITAEAYLKRAVGQKTAQNALKKAKKPSDFTSFLMERYRPSQAEYIKQLKIPVIKEVIKEVPVEKIVEVKKVVEVVKEVVKGDDERTFGDLLGAAFAKLFGIK